MKVIISKNLKKNIVIKKYIKNILISKKKIKINIKVISEKKIKTLNKKYRQKNKGTDILTFKNEILNKKKYIGDIILCLKIMNKKRITLEKGVIHSILHLLEYDHLKKKDSKIMQQIENKVGMSGIEPPTITTSK